MNDPFATPTREQVSAWADHSRPAAVVRLRCRYGHDVAEYWLTVDDDTHFRSQVNSVTEEGVFDEAVAPEDDEDLPTRTRLRLRCPRPSCPWEAEMREDGRQRERLDQLLRSLRSWPGTVDALVLTLTGAERLVDHAAPVAISLDWNEWSRRVASGF